MIQKARHGPFFGSEHLLPRRIRRWGLVAVLQHLLAGFADVEGGGDDGGDGAGDGACDEAVDEGGGVVLAALAAAADARVGPIWIEDFARASVPGVG